MDYSSSGINVTRPEYVNFFCENWIPCYEKGLPFLNGILNIYQTPELLNGDFTLYQAGKL